MKKNGILKRILCVILVVTFVQITFESTLLKVFAEEAIYKNKVREYCKDNPLDGYLLLQKQKETGKMDKELENKFNEQGIFDDEIYGMSDEDIGIFEEAEDIYVCTEYVEYVYGDVEENIINHSEIIEKKEEKQWKQKEFDFSTESDIINQLMDSENMNNSFFNDCQSREMSCEEIDTLIEEMYLDTILEDEESMLDKVLMNVGLKAKEVFAVSKNDQIIQQTSYLKKILILSQKDDKIYVCFNCIWLKTPENRLLDMVGIEWQGGVRILGDDTHPYHAEMTYNRDVQSIPLPNLNYSAKISSERVVVDRTSDFFKNYKSGKASASFELPDDEFHMGGGYRTTVYCTDIRTRVSFWLKNNGEFLDISADYQHQKKAFSTNVANFVTSATLVVSIFTTTGKIAKGVLVIASVYFAGESVGIESYYETCGGARCDIIFEFK